MDENNIDIRYVKFSLGGMVFEYDEVKNQKNIEKHGISFRSAARVFWDYDRIELYDEENSVTEDRFNTIGDFSVGSLELNVYKQETTSSDSMEELSDNGEVVFVVYTERFQVSENGMKTDVTRLISARYATSFERGLYYGKC